MGYATATSFFGCGTTLYGWRPAAPGHHVVTRWITVAFFPLVPLGSYTIDFMRDGRVGWDYVVSVFGVVRDSLEGEPTPSICWGQVINTYLYAYLPWAIAPSCGRLVPDLVAWIVALLILSSWVFAAIKMRRAVRWRVPGKTNSSS